MTTVDWRLDAEVIGIGALVAGDAAAMLAACNPSLFTVRAFRSSKGKDAENTKGDIRIGMAMGSALALIIAAGATMVTRSWWPLLIGIISVAAFDAAYEWALRNPHNRRKHIADQ